MKNPGGKKIIIYLMVLAAVCLLQVSGVFGHPENSVEDMLYQTGGRVSPDIYIIGIDEETISKYGPYDTWSRTKLADILDVLNADPEHKPAVIAIDIGFYGNKEPETDRKLADAVQRAGNVVLTDTATFGNVAGAGNQVIVYEEPYEELKNAAAGNGHANVQLDEDGVVRHAAGSVSYNGEVIPSFDMAVYRKYLESEGKELGPDSPGYFGLGSRGFYIVYSGKPRDYYGSIGSGCSFYKVLEGEYPARAFQDAIVFIGGYASGLQDNYYSAIDKNTQMFGVEIHANIVNQLIEGIRKTELSPAAALLPTLVCGLLAILFILLFDMKIAAAADILLAVLYVFAAKVAFGKLNILLPVIAPAAAVLLIVIVYVAVSYFTVHQEKKRIIDNYGKYLSPEIAKSIADIGENSLMLGGTKKDIAVLFVDIRSFTTLSESLPPERVVEMLNSYLKVTTTAIFDNQGTVDKFIGDATMGVFNAPLDLPDYTYKAVCAGLEMAELGKGLDANLPDDLKGRVGFGIGINCGDAVVGNIGTDFRMEYTAIGDTVNTASRLEGQAKAGNVVISEAVYERVKDRIRCESLGSVKLKGKAEEVRIFRAVEKI